MGSIYEGICAGFMKLGKYEETLFISPILDAYHLGDFLGSFHEKEIFFKISYIFALLDAYQVKGHFGSLHEKYLKAWNILGSPDAYHMRDISGPKIFFCKTPSQNPVFTAISEGVLSLSMYLDNFILIHLIHSSPPEPGVLCAMTILCERQPRASTAG